MKDVTELHYGICGIQLLHRATAAQMLTIVFF